MRIAIIHPEGNFNNNPHLAATIVALCDRNYRVDIHAIKKPFSQSPPHPDARVFLHSRYVMRFARLFSLSRFGRWLAALLCRFGLRHDVADLYIGVDDNGLIVADYLGSDAKRPVALISYELLFTSETSKRRKRAEIHASRNIAFAVVQDSERGGLLAVENQIDPAKLIYMPVADWSSATAQAGWLREKLGIDDKQRIALAMGSMDSWTGLDVVLENLSCWPDDWVLVLHGRYGLSEEMLPELLRNKPNRLFFSTEPFDTNDELGRLLGDVDIGLGLYCPDYQHEHTGLNLKHIGLASGKIATFLRFGVPVLVNFDGEMADAVTSEGLGVVVSEVEEIPAALNDVGDKDSETSQRCQEFFDNRLAVSAHLQPLLDAIEASHHDRPANRPIA